MKHNLITCTAVTDFTEFVPNFGQVHGDPNNPDATHPEVPEQIVGKLAAAGKIADPGKANAATPKGPRSPAKTKAGKKRASSRGTAASESVNTGDYAMTYRPVGKYEITGPGLAKPLVITGNKDAAMAKIAELAAAGDTDENSAPPVD